MENQNEIELNTESEGSENEVENEVVEASNIEASAVPTTETAAPRKRGRPKGIKVGPRSVAWVCAAIVDDELIHVRLSAPDGASDEERAGFTADNARAAFEEDYGVEPSVLGPFYDQKGGQDTAAPKRMRETVSIPLENIKLTTQRVTAIFKDWRGNAYGIEGRDDVMWFMPHTEIMPNPDKPKRVAPSAKPVLRSALKFENS